MSKQKRGTLSETVRRPAMRITGNVASNPPASYSEVDTAAVDEGQKPNSLNRSLRTLTRFSALYMGQDPYYDDDRGEGELTLVEKRLLMAAGKRVLFEAGEFTTSAYPPPGCDDYQKWQPRANPKQEGDVPAPSLGYIFSILNVWNRGWPEQNCPPKTNTQFNEVPPVHNLSTDGQEVAMRTLAMEHAPPLPAKTKFFSATAPVQGPKSVPGADNSEESVSADKTLFGDQAMKRFRRCFAELVCEFLRCLGDIFCSTGSFVMPSGGLGGPLKDCLGRLVCGLIGCIQELLCPEQKPSNCVPCAPLAPNPCVLPPSPSTPPTLAHCNFAVEAIPEK